MTPRVVEIRFRRTLPSWNHFYAGVHWAQRSIIRQEWHNLVKLEVLAQLGIRDRRAFVRPVRISISCEFQRTRSMLDPDNLCAKLAIDGLKGLLIEDDGPEFVHSVLLGPCTRGPEQLTLVRIEEVAP